MRGLKAAVTKVLSATWQRCRVHFTRNVLAHAGKIGRVVSAFIATAFAQETPEAASAHLHLFSQSNQFGPISAAPDKSIYNYADEIAPPIRPYPDCHSDRRYGE